MKRWRSVFLYSWRSWPCPYCQYSNLSYEIPLWAIQTPSIRRESFRGAGLRSLHQRSSRSDTLSPSPGAAFMPFIHITLFFFCFCFVFPSVFPLFFPGLFLRKFVLRDWGGKTRPVDTASGKSKNPATAGVSFSHNEQTWHDESVWCRPCATALGGNQIKGNLQISM